MSSFPNLLLLIFPQAIRKDNINFLKDPSGKFASKVISVNTNTASCINSSLAEVPHHLDRLGWMKTIKDLVSSKVIFLFSVISLG